jgi:hypothetical protein
VAPGKGFEPLRARGPLAGLPTSILRGSRVWSPHLRLWRMASAITTPPPRHSLKDRRVRSKNVFSPGFTPGILAVLVHRIEGGVQVQLGNQPQKNAAPATDYTPVDVAIITHENLAQFLQKASKQTGTRTLNAFETRNVVSAPQCQEHPCKTEPNCIIEQQCQKPLTQNKN